MSELNFKIAKELVQIAFLGENFLINEVMYDGLSENEKIVFLLSNAIKTSIITIEDIKREDFSNDIIDAIEALQQYDGKNVKEYIALLKKHPIALAVEIKNTQFVMKNNTRSETECTNNYSVFLKLLTT